MGTTVTLDQLKQHFDARDLAAEILGVPLKRSGKTWLFRVRSECTASFAVYANGYKDFGAPDDFGDVFALLVRLGAASSRDEAAQQLCDRFTGSGGMLTAQRRTQPTAEHAADPPPAAWQLAMSAALDKFHAYLLGAAPDAQRARAWLHARGITDELIAQYRLGYNPRWHKTNYVLPESGDAKRRVTIPPGVTIGWFAAQALWAVHVRCRETKLAAALGLPADRDADGVETAKYKFVTGSHIRGALFNGDTLTNDQPVLFVEGEFDAMLAAAALNGVNVVTLGGASTRLAGRWRRQIAGAAFVCLDNDQAGQAGAAALLKQLPPTAQRITLPAEKDITDYLLSGGDLLTWWAQSTRLTSTRNATELHPETAQYFTGGTPDSWREALLKIDPAAALTYEVLTEGLRGNDMIDPDAVTVAALLKTVAALGWGVSESTIRRGVKTLTAIFFSDLPAEKDSYSPVCKSERNPQGGRPGASWALLPLAEAQVRLVYAVTPRIVERACPVEASPDQPAVLRELSPRALADAGILDEAAAVELAQVDRQLPRTSEDRRSRKRVERQCLSLIEQLDNPHSTPLALAGEGWAPRSAALYRETYLRALKIADPDQRRSNREIAEALGLKSRKTAAAVVRRAGLAVHGEQYEPREIQPAANVEREVMRLGYEVRGKPRFVVVETAGDALEVPYSVAEVERQLDRGAKVTVKFQVANRHEVIEDAKPMERQRPIGRTVSHVDDADPQPAERRAAVYAPAEEVPPVGYSPEWVRGQLALRLKRLGCVHEGKFFNRETGELLPMDASAGELLEPLIGRKVRRTTGSAAALLRTAAALGATVTAFAQ